VYYFKFFFLLFVCSFSSHSHAGPSISDLDKHVEELTSALNSTVLELAIIEKSATLQMSKISENLQHINNSFSLEKIFITTVVSVITGTLTLFTLHYCYYCLKKNHKDKNKKGQLLNEGDV
jgi:hypothetical protein